MYALIHIYLCIDTQILAICLHVFVHPYSCTYLGGGSRTSILHGWICLHICIYIYIVCALAHTMYAHTHSHTHTRARAHNTHIHTHKHMHPPPSPPPTSTHTHRQTYSHNRFIQPPPFCRVKRQAATLSDISHLTHVMPDACHSHEPSHVTGMRDTGKPSNPRHACLMRHVTLTN